MGLDLTGTADVGLAGDFCALGVSVVVLLAGEADHTHGKEAVAEGVLLELRIRPGSLLPGHPTKSVVNAVLQRRIVANRLVYALCECGYILFSLAGLCVARLSSASHPFAQLQMQPEERSLHFFVLAPLSIRHVEGLPVFLVLRKDTRGAPVRLVAFQIEIVHGQPASVCFVRSLSLRQW